VADYRPGAQVHVAQFGKGLVREARNNGRYLVEVKGRAMEVMESQLSPVEGRRINRTPRVGSLDPTDGQAGEGGVVTLDLHGHTVEEALDALAACLSNALLAGAAEIRVIHGKSGGRVRAAVHHRLRELPAVRHFRLDPRNTGVTILKL